MTIQTIREASLWTTKTKVLAAGLVVAMMLAASLLAPAQAAAYPGENGKIFFSSNRSTGAGVDNPEGDFEIFSMNPDGTGLKQLTKNDRGDSQPSVSANGSRVAFVSQRVGNSEIFVMNADGTEQTNVTNNGVFNILPSISPDGNKIAFRSSLNGGADIFVKNADGTGTATDLTHGVAFNTGPQFSPDGKKIAFSSSRDGNLDIFTMNADGTGSQVNLTLDTVPEDLPTFSPDGKKIAFVREVVAGDDDIAVINANGTGLTPIASSAKKETAPAFSPDGTKIAFDGDLTGNNDVFVMPASGGAVPDNLTDASEASDFNVDWQPVAPLVVNSTGDQPDADLLDAACDADGSVGVNQCTLRAAIDQANHNAGPDKINFDIPGTGVHTIDVGASGFGSLPEITDRVAIDGYTQPGAHPNTKTVGNDAKILIELNGTSTGFGTGLSIDGASGCVIRGLVVNRFGDEGIALSGDVSSGATIAINNRIEGNFIGTDPSGTQDLGNVTGVLAKEGSSGTIVGGATAAARNLISGNRTTAVKLDTGGSSANKVQGNYIGTDRSGQRALANSSGVIINGGANNLIGGARAAARNLISGNDGTGVIVEVGSTGNKVLGNRIGTTANGTGALGNGLNGVNIIPASNNTIGDGTAAGANTIAFNGLDGVQIVAFESTPDSSNGNSVLSNSIFSNGDLGIDLDDDGPTANDPGDEDLGSNRLQNKPVLTSARSSSRRTTVKGKLNSASNGSYTLEFFSNKKGNEGKRLIGRKTVTANNFGDAAFTFKLKKVKPGQTVTATATNNSTGDTSEFSAPRKVKAS